MVGEPMATTLSGRTRKHGPKHWYYKQKVFFKQIKHVKTTPVPIKCSHCGKQTDTYNSLRQCLSCQDKIEKQYKKAHMKKKKRKPVKHTTKDIAHKSRQKSTLKQTKQKTKSTLKKRSKPLGVGKEKNTKGIQ